MVPITLLTSRKHRKVYVVPDVDSSYVFLASENKGKNKRYWR